MIPEGHTVKISNSGLELIKRFEGLRLSAYPDPGTNGKPWSIGYGHTLDVERGDVITLAKAEEFLRQDCERFEDGVESLVKVPIAQHEFDALVAFSFNVGLGNLKASTLLRLLNAGERVKAAEQFLRWDHANGKSLLGLKLRRQAEMAMFMGH